MEVELDLLLLDNSNNIIEERIVQKPNTCNELKIAIKNNLIKLPKYYEIFYNDENNNKKIINNDEEYKLSKDVLFIKESKDDDKAKDSIYELNYDKLSESKQDLLDDIYNCNICQVNIKGEEKPLLCYRCQKLFHKKCLENWDIKCNEKNVKFSCPKCKYDLPFNEWHEKLNYNDDRLKDVNMMKELTNKDQLNNGLKSELSMFKSNTNNIYENILNKIDKINSLFEKSNPLIENNINIYDKCELPNKIIDGLNNIEESIKNIEKKYHKEIPIEKILCKISYEKKENDKNIKDKVVGFFCEMDKNFPIKYALFTNYHILKEENIKIGKYIEIEYFNELGYIIKNIEITKKRKVYSDSKLNYICIEILESDNIKYFFKIESGIYQNNINLLDKEAIMFQYFNNNFLSANGKILSIEDYLIKHNIPINTKYSGSPLIIKSNNENFLIGLYYGEGIFDLAIKFNYILDDIKNKFKINNEEKQDFKNEINCFYYAGDNQQTIRLIHDYNDLFNIEDSSKETREPHLQARVANQAFFMKNIEIFINDKKVDFTFRYKREISDPKFIRVKFKFKKLLHNMSFMFSGCLDLLSIDLSSLNTSKVNNMSYMFKECESLFNANFNSVNTSKVANMKSMFYRCKSLKSLDLSSFKTNKVIDMSEMFYGCDSLESLNVSSFNVKNVINMSNMFKFCSNLTSLDLSSFNTCCALNMSYMFSFCDKLTFLDISLFDTEGANIYKIFEFCTHLKKENIKIKNKSDKINRIKKIGF